MCHPHRAFILSCDVRDVGVAHSDRGRGSAGHSVAHQKPSEGPCAAQHSVGKDLAAHSNQQHLPSADAVRQVAEDWRVESLRKGEGRQQTCNAPRVHAKGLCQNRHKGREDAEAKGIHENDEVASKERRLITGHTLPGRVCAATEEPKRHGHGDHDHHRGELDIQLALSQHLAHLRAQLAQVQLLQVAGDCPLGICVVGRSFSLGRIQLQGHLQQQHVACIFAVVGIIAVDDLGTDDGLSSCANCKPWQQRRCTPH
mmetsp:Transcript_98912/g.235966  ORF Transcript_98912/g.235966 Transcript_98912/m.235966 type:complete len:256 (-) Transcript_98912:17-784(-)